MVKGRLQKLESIRGLAAFYVVLHHLVRSFLPHRWYRLPFIFGPEAVMVFFVLSGFVIHYSTRISPADLGLRNYSVKRIRRIYPIFLCALVAGYLSHAIITRGLFIPNLQMLAGNLAMFQGRSIDPFYNGPLWSLSYEWWFYVLFFVVIKLEASPSRQKFWAAGFSLIGVVTALIFMNQPSLFLFYFMIWWCGVELAREYVDDGKITWRRQAFPLGALCGLTLLSLLLVAQGVRQHQSLIAIEYPLLYFRHFLSALVLICAGIAWQKRQFVGFDPLLGWFAVFAPISYAIYVLHLPIIAAVDSVWPGQFVLPKIVLIGSLILGLAWLLEIQMQSWINKWSNRYLTRKPESSLPPVPVKAIRQHAAA